MILLLRIQIIMMINDYGGLILIFWPNWQGGGGYWVSMFVFGLCSYRCPIVPWMVTLSILGRWDYNTKPLVSLTLLDSRCFSYVQQQKFRAQRWWLRYNSIHTYVLIQLIHLKYHRTTITFFIRRNRTDHRKHQRSLESLLLDCLRHEGRLSEYPYLLMSMKLIPGYW